MIRKRSKEKQLAASMSYLGLFQDLDDLHASIPVGELSGGGGGEAPVLSCLSTSPVKETSR